jgi:hypothetical protein
MGEVKGGIRLAAIDTPFEVRNGANLGEREVLYARAAVTAEQAQRQNEGRKALAARFREQGQMDRAVTLECQEPVEETPALAWTVRRCVQEAMFGGAWPNKPKANGQPVPETAEDAARMAKIGLAFVDAAENATVVLSPKDFELVRRKAAEAAGPRNVGTIPLIVHAKFEALLDIADGSHENKKVLVEAPASE